MMKVRVHIYAFAFAGALALSAATRAAAEPTVDYSYDNSGYVYEALPAPPRTPPQAPRSRGGDTPTLEFTGAQPKTFFFPSFPKRSREVPVHSPSAKPTALKTK